MFVYEEQTWNGNHHLYYDTACYPVDENPECYSCYHDEFGCHSFPDFWSCGNASIECAYDGLALAAFNVAKSAVTKSDLATATATLAQQPELLK